MDLLELIRKQTSDAEVDFLGEAIGELAQDRALKTPLPEETTIRSRRDRMPRVGGPGRVAHSRVPFGTLAGERQTE